MTWKKTLIRNLLFFIFAATLGLFCTGCFTAGTWNYLGKTETYFIRNSSRYHISQDGSAGYCWKVLWMPAAVIADVIALPVYLINPGILIPRPSL